MEASIRRRFELYARSGLTWDPVAGGKRSPITWNDRLDEDLGPDPDGQRFDRICRRMLGGRYYPPDAIDFFGKWTDENRDIRAGDRILQRARIIPFLGWPVAWAMTEVFIAERTDGRCTLGYVTTRKHFGRGIWKAALARGEKGLRLQVSSVSGPQSWQFWLFLPLARFLQLRAWRRAVEEFRKL